MTRAPWGFSLGSAPTRAGPVHARQGGDRLRAQAWNNAADSHTVGPPICEFTRYLCDIASQHCCYFLRPGCVLVGGHRDLRSLGITDCR